MSKQKLFFSYSRNDAASFASKLANDLEQAGFDIWIDQQDIPAGRNWDLEIEQALESCDCLLFIESEKSVASNNVLDEVYYALGQNKKVIPVIYHDSKTPFRLQRLQHIDFTKDYEAGLANLLAELRGQKYPHSHGSQGNVNQPPAGFFKKYLIPVLIVILLFVAGTVALLRKKGKYQDEQQHTATVANIDTGAKVMNKVKTIEEPETVRIESPAVQTTAATSTPSINAKRKFVTPKIITTPKIVNNTQPPNAAPAKLSPDGLAGNWQLVNVLPKHASHKGYIKIEMLQDDRIKIISSFQFYFKPPNAEAFFSVFNGFASCNNCAVKKELFLPEKDISFGTQRYKILKTDVAGEGKAGDTTADIGGNSTVPASVSLRFTDERNAIIKVSQPAATPISNDFVVPPFAYEFYFKKSL